MSMSETERLRKESARDYRRIAELEAINSSMADDLCSMTGAYERAEQAEANLKYAVSQLESMRAELNTGAERIRKAEADLE